MKKFALLSVYVNGEEMVFVESTDRHFVKQVVEDLKSSHFIQCDLSVIGPNRVRLGTKVKDFRPFDVYEHCCKRGWEPFQVLNGELLFRKEIEEEAGG